MPSSCLEGSYLRKRWLVVRVPSWEHQESSHNVLIMNEQKREKDLESLMMLVITAPIPEPANCGLPALRDT